MKHTLFWLLKQIRRRLPAVVLLSLAQGTHALLAVFFALSSRNVIDSAIAGEQAAFSSACLHQAAIIGGILLLYGLVRHLRDRLDADLERDWKQQLLHGLLHGEYTRVAAYHSGELLNRLNNDVAKVNEGILLLAPSAVAMVTRLVAAVVVLGNLDARFTLLILVLGGGAIAATGLIRSRLKSLNKQVSLQDGRVSAFLQEIMEKLLMVQAMDTASEVENRADILLEERYEVQRKRKNVSLAANLAVSCMGYGAGFLALVWCGWQMLQGRMTAGALTAVIQLVSQLQSPFVNLSGLMPKYIAMTASAERLMELEAIQRRPAECLRQPLRVYAAASCIRGEGLCFSHDRDRVLDDASFALPKGAFAVITGRSGIGKSTLLKLLLGIFPLEAGALYLEGADGKLAIDRSTRNLFAYVPQGNLVLSGTLRENLTIVRPKATQEELQQAICVSAMEDFLPALPMGLDTQIGESGLGLSEGQVQRLAIARAVLGGAPILLLDECTSALDEETERKVLQRLRSLPDRTCLAVSHRPAALELSDWKLELRNGRIYVERMEGA